VIISNHQSTWETLYLSRLFNPCAIILKRELLFAPLFGWAMALLRPIAINRGSQRDALRQVLKKGTARLAEGSSVLIFPEGTRLGTGQQGNYARSGAALAIRAGVEVLPVAHDAGRYWPARRFSKRPGEIQLMIGPPIAIENRNASELTELAREWIEKALAEAAKGTAASESRRRSPAEL